MGEKKPEPDVETREYSLKYAKGEAGLEDQFAVCQTRSKMARLSGRSSSIIRAQRNGKAER
jgi:hypothetical protein